MEYQFLGENHEEASTCTRYQSHEHDQSTDNDAVDHAIVPQSLFSGSFMVGKPSRLNRHALESKAAREGASMSSVWTTPSSWNTEGTRERNPRCVAAASCSRGFFTHCACLNPDSEGYVELGCLSVSLLSLHIV